MISFLVILPAKLPSPVFRLVPCLGLQPPGNLGTFLPLITDRGSERRGSPRRTGEAGRSPFEHLPGLKVPPGSSSLALPAYVAEPRAGITPFASLPQLASIFMRSPGDRRSLKASRPGDEVSPLLAMRVHRERVVASPRRPRCCPQTNESFRPFQWDCPPAPSRSRKALPSSLSVTMPKRP